MACSVSTQLIFGKVENSYNYRATVWSRKHDLLQSTPLAMCSLMPVIYCIENMSKFRKNIHFGGVKFPPKDARNKH